MIQKAVENWQPEDQEFWQARGAKVASRNLWSSIPCLLCAFAIWGKLNLCKTMQNFPSVKNC